MSSGTKVGTVAWGEPPLRRESHPILNTRLLSAQQGARHLRSRYVREKPLDQALIRRLLVLKLWRGCDAFARACLMKKFEYGRDFDRDDLHKLLNRTAVIDRQRITADCVRGFGFLAELTVDEQTLANDRHQWERTLAEQLRAGL